MRLVTPVEVSLWTTQTALIACARSSRELSLDCARIDAVPPVAGNQVDDQAQACGNLLPERREMAGLGHEHLIAGRQGVHQRGLPRAGSGSRIDDDRAARTEHRAQPLEQLLAKNGKLGTAMVHRWAGRWPGGCDPARSSGRESAENGGRCDTSYEHPTGLSELTTHQGPQSYHNSTSHMRQTWNLQPLRHACDADCSRKRRPSDTTP